MRILFLPVILSFSTLPGYASDCMNRAGMANHAANLKAQDFDQADVLKNLRKTCANPLKNMTPTECADGEKVIAWVFDPAQADVGAPEAGKVYYDKFCRKEPGHE